MARRTKTEEFSIADALSAAQGEFESLQEEMQSWYDNMPESLQGGDKGSQVEEAASALDNAAQMTIPEELENTTDSDDKPLPGGLRFQFQSATRKRMSRADRCSEATALARAAVERVQEYIAEFEEKHKDEEEPTAEVEAEREMLEGLELDEIETAIEEAEGVEFPGAYG